METYWTADIIFKQWYQAKPGVYPSRRRIFGPFSGRVSIRYRRTCRRCRPTRDGIHGREYINTQVSLGRKLSRLPFTETGEPILEAPKNIDIPIPIIFGELPFGSLSREGLTALVKAAAALGTVIEIPVNILDQEFRRYAANIIPLLSADSWQSARTWIESAPMVEIRDSAESVSVLREIKKQYPETLVMIKTRLDEKSKWAGVLADEGADIIHLVADRNGNVHSPIPS